MSRTSALEWMREILLGLPFYPVGPAPLSALVRQYEVAT
jgi:hypothetical protein